MYKPIPSEMHGSISWLFFQSLFCGLNRCPAIQHAFSFLPRFTSDSELRLISLVGMRLGWIPRHGSCGVGGGQCVKVNLKGFFVSGAAWYEESEDRPRGLRSIQLCDQSLGERLHPGTRVMVLISVPDFSTMPF